jgi:MFS family permease
MGDIVPEKIRGSVFSTRLLLGTLSALTLTLLGGWFVDGWKTARPEHAIYAYSILFTVGVLFGLAGTFAVTRFPEPEMHGEEEIPLFGLLKTPFEDENFRRLLKFVSVWAFSINLAGPFFIIYMMKRLELGLFEVTVLTVINQGSNLLFLRIWGRLADRLSNKSVLAVSSPMFLLAVLGWTFTTMPDKHFLTVPLLIVIQLLTGMSLAGVSVSSANIALKLSPKGLAHAYMTVHGIIGSLAGAIAPLMGGLMATYFTSRQLSVSLNWSEPGRNMSIHAMDLKSLDFLFFISVIVGFYALHLLSQVREEGEVDEEEVRAHLMAEIAAPFRMITTMAGLRHLATIPFSAIHRLKGQPRSDDIDD